MPIVSDPFFAEIIAWPKALAALAALGFASPTFSDGYIISKPPHSPRLFWHYDWFAWEIDAVTSQSQVFLMYSSLIPGPKTAVCASFLVHTELTTRSTMCSIHAPIPTNSPKAITSTEWNFRDGPDEVDVPIEAGDLGRRCAPAACHPCE